MTAVALDEVAAAVPDDLEAVKEIMQQSGAAQATLEAVEDYTDKAYELLDAVALDDAAKGIFREFGQWLMRRSY